MTSRRLIGWTVIFAFGAGCGGGDTDASGPGGAGASAATASGGAGQGGSGRTSEASGGGGRASGGGGAGGTAASVGGGGTGGSGGALPECPDGRLLQSPISYGVTGSGGVRQNADLTDWSLIWGAGSSTAMPVAWPGITGVLPVIQGFDKTKYLAAKFHVTPGVSKAGSYIHASYLGGPPSTMSISKVCGDFAPADSACLRENVRTGEPLVKWTTTTASGGCKLEPDTDYYVNLRMAADDPSCPGVNCQVGVYNTY